MSKDNGGPAFPSAPMTETELSYGRDMGRSTTQVCNAGMSMRDYFAAAVLMGIHANPKWETESNTDNDDIVYCYAIADAMVEERRK
jgi:hypothetical protein